MPLVVTRIWVGITKQFSLDWINSDRECHIMAAYDPLVDYTKYLFFDQPIVLREWAGHRWYFSVPEGVEVQPTDKWLSDSNGQGGNGRPQVKSEMLYPWFWNFDGYDIICQIAPPKSESSLHYHSRTVEYFVSVLNGRQTYLQINGTENLLDKELRVGLDLPHQLVNKGDTPSVQLLKMKSPFSFPDRKDHVSCHKTGGALV
jgi:hypothetical protein